MGQRCYECFRPISHCFCAAIPRIDNRTEILILQHVGERFHRFNTARIVRKALASSRLIVGHNQDFGAQRLPIGSDACLLYPHASAPYLDELPSDQRPSQLVVIDGTWHQAKTVYRDTPQLHRLPCYRLRPNQPGQFRIRLEPDAQSLSTLEATVAALHALEPETSGIDQLATAFHRMVDQQLELMAASKTARTRKRRTARPRHMPTALLDDPSRLVVAYGESPPGQSNGNEGAAGPVNWLARRLDAGDLFACRLNQGQPLSAAALNHMRLAANDPAEVSQAEFRTRWCEFLRPHDVLIVYHLRTYHLLGQIAAEQPRCLCLKSIFRKWRSDFQSVEELYAGEGLTSSMAPFDSRAAERLHMTMALVRQLRSKYCTLTP